MRRVLLGGRVGGGLGSLLDRDVPTSDIAAFVSASCNQRVNFFVRSAECDNLALIHRRPREDDLLVGCRAGNNQSAAVLDRLGHRHLLTQTIIGCPRKKSTGNRNYFTSR